MGKILGISQVGVNDNYFDLGANSLNILQVNQFVQQELNRTIPVVNYYIYPTIKSFIEYLNKDSQEQNSDTQENNEHERSRKNLRQRRKLLE